MIAVVKCYKHNVKPLVIEVFEGHDEQTQKDANELAAILSTVTGLSMAKNT